jgi:hypothetical protein
MPIIQRIEVRCDLMGFWLFYFMENEIEVWKDVVGYEGLYEVSSIGRLRSLNYPKAKIIKHGLRSGYPSAMLYKESKYKNIFIHIIEAIAFIDPNYLKKGLVVNHKDFNRQNNLLSNLEVVTMRENNNKKHLPSTSKYTGVYLNKGKWNSVISVNRKRIYLGYFNTEIEASRYYEAALICVNEGRVMDIVIKKRENKSYCFDKQRNKWIAYAKENGKQIHLGYLNTEEEAKELVQLSRNTNVNK